MIKSCSRNTVDLPQCVNGFRLNENNEYEIEYFTGYPYPENFTDAVNAKFESDNNNVSDSDSDDCYYSSSDDVYDANSEDEWNG